MWQPIPLQGTADRLDHRLLWPLQRLCESALMADIFVFGSNLAGRHGAGAAATAKLMYGAKPGNGVGMAGRSYAIPTKSYAIKTLPLHVIQGFVTGFLEHARATPENLYVVTRIGCGLAGYKDSEIAPMFTGAPSNCVFDPAWSAFGLPAWATPPYVFQPKGCK